MSAPPVVQTSSTPVAADTPDAPGADPSAAGLLRRYLGDAAASFSIGVPAAVAEFMRRADEPRLDDGAEAFTVATARGAIRLERREDAVAVAYEAPSRHPGRWLHGVAFSLPRRAARMGGRRALSELGPDGAAVRAGDRAALLFDLGVGAPQVDFCVRTADPALIALLRRAAGRALPAWPAELTAALMAAGPHRVVVSRLGRIEVTDPIPHERTPLGPHTHLFPERLGEALSPDPAVPVPDGHVACLQLYPPHPLFDLAGEARAFDRALFGDFQDILAAWGDAGHRALKARVAAALDGGAAPEDFAAGEGPAADAACRVAVRQLACLRPDDGRLAAWRARFDPPPRTGGRG